MLIERSFSQSFRNSMSLFLSSSIKSKDEASSTEEEWDADDKEEPTEEKKEMKIKEEVSIVHYEFSPTWDLWRSSFVNRYSLPPLAYILACVLQQNFSHCFGA